MADLVRAHVLTDGFAQTIPTARWWRTGVISMKSITIRAAEVAQTQLAGNFVSRFEVGVLRPMSSISPAAGGAGGVDIDRGQRFGAIDNDRPAGRQAHFGQAGRRTQVTLDSDLIMAEQRDFTGVQFVLLQRKSGRPSAAMWPGAPAQAHSLRVIDQSFADDRPLAQVVTEGADNDVCFPGGSGNGAGRLSAAFWIAAQCFRRKAQGPTAGLRRICRRRSGKNDQAQCRPEAQAAPPAAAFSVRQYGRRPRYGGKFPGARVVLASVPDSCPPG